MFYYHFVRNLLLSLSVNEFLKIGQHSAKLELKIEWHFFTDTVYVL